MKRGAARKKAKVTEVAAEMPAAKAIRQLERMMNGCWSDYADYLHEAEMRGEEPVSFETVLDVATGVVRLEDVS